MLWLIEMLRKLILGILNILIVLFIQVFYVNAASINSFYEQGHRSYSSVDLKFAEKINSPTSQNLKTATTAGQFLTGNIFFVAVLHGLPLLPVLAALLYSAL